MDVWESEYDRACTCAKEEAIGSSAVDLKAKESGPVDLN